MEDEDEDDEMKGMMCDNDYPTNDFSCTGYTKQHRGTNLFGELGTDAAHGRGRVLRRGGVLVMSFKHFSISFTHDTANSAGLTKCSPVI